MLLGLAIGLAVGFILGSLEGRALGHRALSEIHAIHDSLSVQIAAIETDIKGKL